MEQHTPDKKDKYRTYAQRRRDAEREQERKNEQARMKPRAVLEREARERALSTALDESNPGFRLLQHMGYRGGTEAEDVPAASAMITSGQRPVVDRIEVKTDRSGLGAVTSKAQLQSETESKQRESESKHDAGEQAVLDMVNSTIERQHSVMDYRQRLSQQHRTRQLERDIALGRAACEQLDRARGRTTRHWSWPVDRDSGTNEHACGKRILCDQLGADAYFDVGPGSDCSDGSVSEHRPASKRRRLQLEQESNSERAHIDVSSDSESQCHDMVCSVCFEELPLDEQLTRITMHLRDAHVYCQWCGTTFCDQQELEEQCPGPSRGDHDE
jgi:hypothetical protein